MKIEDIWVLVSSSNDGEFCTSRIIPESHFIKLMFDETDAYDSILSEGFKGTVRGYVSFSTAVRCHHICIDKLIQRLPSLSGYVPEDNEYVQGVEHVTLVKANLLNQRLLADDNIFDIEHERIDNMPGGTVSSVTSQASQSTASRPAWLL